MTPPAAERLYTAEEFFEFTELPENKDKFWELVDGVIIEVPPPSLDHGKLAFKMARILADFVETHQLGEAFGDGMGYTLSINQVRVPDASFISKDRLTTPLKDFKGAPDLAVEVASPRESLRAMKDKAILYLNTGARLVWYILPDEKEVDVYRPAERGVNVETLDINSILDGGDVLPNFKLPVKDIFPEYPSMEG